MILFGSPCLACFPETKQTIVPRLLRWRVLILGAVHIIWVYVSLLRLHYIVATFEPELREYVFFTKVVRFSTRSSGSMFSLLQLYAATFEPELREYVFFTTVVRWDFRAGALRVRFLYYGCATKLRLSSRSSGSTVPLLR